MIVDLLMVVVVVRVIQFVAPRRDTAPVVALAHDDHDNNIVDNFG